MCIWQSQAFGGACIFGASLPVELGTTCWARPSGMGIAPAAIIAAAPLMKLRRAIDSSIRMAGLQITDAQLPNLHVRGDGCIEPRPLQPACGAAGRCLHSAPVRDMVPANQPNRFAMIDRLCRLALGPLLAL